MKKVKKLGMSLLVSVVFFLVLMTLLRVVGGELRGRDDRRQVPAPSARLEGPECSRRYGYPGDLSACLIRGYRHPGDGFAVDDRGFASRDGADRTRNLAIPKPAGVQRIACLGGSTTNNMWPTYLGRILSRRHGDAARHEVVNAALNGYVARDLLIRFRHDVAAIEPDLVLIYSGWNDLAACSIFSEDQSDAMRAYSETGDEEVLEHAGDPWITDHMEWLRERYVERRRTPAVFRGESALAVQRILDQLPGAEDIAAVRRFVRRGDFVVDDMDQVLEGPSPFDAGFQGGVWAENIRTLAEEARRTGATVGLVIPPHAFGCKPVRAYRCSSGFALTPRDRFNFIDVAVPAILERIARSTGSFVIGLDQITRREDHCALFAAEPGKGPGDELHLNDAGLQIVAETVYREIQPYLPGGPYTGQDAQHGLDSH